MARIGEAIGRYKGGELGCVEAAELLGMSERHFADCAIAMNMRARRG